jgi:hypothetical protein
MTGWFVNDELVEMQREAVFVFLKRLPYCLCGGAEEEHEELGEISGSNGGECEDDDV